MWEKFLEEKIFNKQTLIASITRWRLKNKKIVFTNGCFDLLHLGHINYLIQAANLGDQLIVGVNSDNSVKKLKGNNRPINNENSRLNIIASLFFVSGVILFDEDTPYELIKDIQPEVLVKGGDYTVDTIVGADVVAGNGGKVEVIELTKGYSTSLIEQKIIENIK